MPRFFKENFSNDPILSEDDSAHIVRSLRMKNGESLTVCDLAGKDYLCKIISADPKAVKLEIINSLPTQSEPKVNVTLFTGLLKGDKNEQVLRHAVELGITEFVPVLFNNCVSRPDLKSANAKIKRWQKIANEAAGQSGRGILPRVKRISSFSDLCTALKDFDLVLFFYEAGGIPLSEAVTQKSKAARNIAVITGPEGGFTPDEAKLLAEHGAKTITLGRRILRAETAPLAALTGVMLLTDNLE